MKMRMVMAREIATEIKARMMFMMMIRRRRMFISMLMLMPMVVTIC